MRFTKQGKDILIGMNKSNHKDNILTELLWAKSMPYKNLYEHMRETSIVSKVLLSDTMYESVCSNIRIYLSVTAEEAKALITYLAALHDIGKCHPLFQCKDVNSDVFAYISENSYLKYPFEAERYRHEIGSSDAVRFIWRKKKIFDYDLIRAFSATLKLHHQGKGGKSFSLDDSLWEGGTEWIRQQEYLEKIFFERISPPVMKVNNVKQLDAACTMITAIVIISDWISSNSYFTQFNCDSTDEEIENAASHFIKMSGIGHQNSIRSKTFPELWRNIPADSMRPLQYELNRYLLDKSELPLLLILEAPMGEGKTEAGLFSALKMAEYWKKEGAYIALPTSATSNQMYDRVSELLDNHHLTNARLMHSMSWMVDDVDLMSANDGAESDIQNWTNPSKLSLLAPYAVGTIDQILMAALKVKYGVLRIFGLSGKVLFIDEVHAYDAYMSSILKKLLEWCRVLSIPVVLLSATLPVWKKQEMLDIYNSDIKAQPAFQQITAVFNNGKTEQTQINKCVQDKTISMKRIIIPDGYENRIIEVLLEKMPRQGCACVIVNTIKKAQVLYEFAKKYIVDTEVVLFHSAFTVARRLEIEKYCLDSFGKDKRKRPSKCILIATQVVEQSLDLDFDFMMSEIAPIDLLLQRAGRLHRHSDTKRPGGLEKPELWVFVPPENSYGSTGFIYYNHLLDRTNEILSTLQVIEIPENIPELVEYVYQREEFSEDETERFMQQLFSEQLMDVTARGIELGSPMEDEFGLAENRMELLDDEEESWASAKTRLGEDSIRFAILPENLFKSVEQFSRSGKAIQKDIAKKIMEYSVSVSKKRFRIWFSKDESIKILKGNGKLSGMILIDSGLGYFSPTVTITLDTENWNICLDRYVGLIFKKKGEADNEI